MSKLFALSLGLLSTPLALANDTESSVDKLLDSIEVAEPLEPAEELQLEVDNRCCGYGYRAE